MVSVGGAWDDFEDMAMPSINALCDYLKEWPPAHMLLRSFTGYKPPPAVTRTMGGDGRPMTVSDFFKRIPAAPAEVSSPFEIGVMKASPDG